MTGENAVEGGEAAPLRRILSRGEPGRQAPVALEALLPELVHLPPPGGVRGEPGLSLLTEGGVLLKKPPAEARVVGEVGQALCGRPGHRSRVSGQFLGDGRAQYSGGLLHPGKPATALDSRLETD